MHTMRLLLLLYLYVHEVERPKWALSKGLHSQIWLSLLSCLRLHWEQVIAMTPVLDLWWTVYKSCWLLVRTWGAKATFSSSSVLSNMSNTKHRKRTNQQPFMKHTVWEPRIAFPALHRASRLAMEFLIMQSRDAHLKDGRDTSNGFICLSDLLSRSLEWSEILSFSCLCMLFYSRILQEPGW